MLQPTSSPPSASLPPAARTPILFPPQRVMENGDYTRFLNDNRQTLTRCTLAPDCEEALFNLGFVHAYSKSPHYNPSKALHYFDELNKKYPHTPGAAAGRAWGTLLRDNIALEEKRRRLQNDLRAKDGGMRTLQEQLNRSRELDLQLEQKERDILR